MRALFNISGQLDCFIPELFSGASPEADGKLRTLSGLADTAQDGFGSAVRESFQMVSCIDSPHGARAAGMATAPRPVFPAAELSPEAGAGEV